MSIFSICHPALSPYSILITNISKYKCNNISLAQRNSTYCVKRLPITPVAFVIGTSHLSVIVHKVRNMSESQVLQVLL